MVEPAILTKSLAKRFGDVTAVTDLNLRVPRGEAYGFLGLNGAGKTTTVRMLTGVLPPTRGRALVAGVDVTEAPRGAARSIGVVFGENLVPEPQMSPVRYLRHFGSLYGMARRDVDARAHELFSVLRLGEFSERPIGTLSGGNRRKVELARALLHEPAILFLDEPTRELDIPAKRSVWKFLQRLTSEEGLTLFISTHDVQEVASLCQRIGVIRRGVLDWEGAPAELTAGGVDLVDGLAAKLEGDDGAAPRARA